MRLTVVAIVLLLASAAAGVPPGSQAAREALQLCTRADQMEADTRTTALETVRTMAEHALEQDARDARAHFALVCALGKQTRDAGLGIGQLLSLRRLQRALDATLALAPDDGDALAAKGALLFSLPRLLGGDSEEAERLLRRALVVDPENTDARCYLRRALDARGAGDEARALQLSC
jgi:hypothetical protein